MSDLKTPVGWEATSGEFPELASENLRVWEANAAWWDERTTESDETHRTLINPATGRLLDLQPGERVLDAACGNGAFARLMAERYGVTVTAFDASDMFIERARRRTAGHPAADRISYAVIDSADSAQLLRLGRGSFDAAVCKMALMDMPVIEPLISALAELLRPGGRVVFSVTHPAFNSTGNGLVLEERADDAGNLVVERAVKTFRYITPEARLGTGIRGQPEPQYYFHRPLSLLFGTFFRNGFVLDGIEELVFGPEHNSAWPFGWSEYKEIPGFLAARMRLDTVRAP